jgi:hypothetical protein
LIHFKSKSITILKEKRQGVGCNLQEGLNTLDFTGCDACIFYQLFIVPVLDLKKLH